jgi:hypothetical protein
MHRAAAVVQLMHEFYIAVHYFQVYKHDSFVCASQDLLVCSVHVEHSTRQTGIQCICCA